MAVRAKVYVQSVEITRLEPEGPVGNVKLAAVTRGEENKDWSHWTPALQLTMSTLNPAAFREFQALVGSEMYLDFTPIPEA